MAQKSPLYFTPPAHLGAAHLLKHQAPQLVGRLPHLRANGLMAAAKLAQRRSAKVPSLLKPLKPLAPL